MTTLLGVLNRINQNEMHLVGINAALISHNRCLYFKMACRLLLTYSHIVQNGGAYFVIYEACNLQNHYINFSFKGV